MVYDEDLLLQLEHVGWGPFSQVVSRRIFAGRPPLAENTDGARWNPTGVAALYTSLTDDTAVAEHENLISLQGRRPKLQPELRHVDVKVARCMVLDAETLTRLGVDFGQPDEPECRAACQRIGGAAAHLNAEALLVPSLRIRGASNLVLFTTNIDLPAGSYIDLVED